ncbi:MAG: aromatic amino acid transaminase [Paracoccaceae bacterium]
MFETLKPQPADKILGLIKMYRDDPRETKIDLGLGVYKDADGKTPIMRAVKQAEQQIWSAQDSKSYTGLAGDAAFSDAMIDLVLGGVLPRDQIAAVATPGGTGACRQAFELMRMANPTGRVFVSNPTWPNHVSILKYLGIEVVMYRYFDSESRGVDMNGMLEDLADARAGDLVLLHGCCHNPTGANLNPTEWDAVIACLQKTGAVAMVDIAYQGFGDGLQEDAAATRKLAENLPEVLIAASCSKNFGVYRERTGILMATAETPAVQAMAQGTLEYLNRQNYSFPPDHGARIVTTVLTDAALRADWQSELEEVRQSMLGLRAQLAQELQALSGSDRFAFLAHHRGMFSRLGTTPDMVDKLRIDHGIYMVGDSRMNIAGLNTKTVPILAKAIIACGI